VGSASTIFLNAAVALAKSINSATVVLLPIISAVVQEREAGDLPGNLPIFSIQPSPAKLVVYPEDGLDIFVQKIADCSQSSWSCSNDNSSILSIIDLWIWQDGLGFAWRHRAGLGTGGRGEGF